MAGGLTIGGGNQFDVFPLTSSGGNWVVGTRLASIRQVKKVAKTGYHISKNTKFVPETNLTGTVLDSILAYVVPTATVDTGNYNDGTPYSPFAGVAEKLLAIVNYGGVDSSDDTRIADIGVVQVSGGDKTEEYGKIVSTKLEFMVLDNPVPLVYAANLFDTTQFLTPVLTTLAAKSTGGQLRQAKAA